MPQARSPLNRPLRSWMFVPGNVERFIEKALTMEGGPDAVFLDLEDGVLPEAKPDARRMVAVALARPAGGPLRTVRVNAVGSEWFEQDMQHILVPGLEGVCLPKVESTFEVEAAAERLELFERTHRMELGSVALIAAIESGAGLIAAPAIASAHERMLALMLGAEDFALSLGLGTQREGEAQELIYARSAVVVAAASAGIVSIDGVFPNLSDPEGLLADVLQARRLGFRAKSTFNPRQVELINQIFSPSADEIRYAERIVEAFQEAQSRGEGSVAVGGQLVDLPIVRRAQRTLDLARGDDLGRSVNSAQ